MSLIIAYVGKKGCVMASDKRKIGYFGDKQNLNKLEEELYGGKLTNDDDFLKRAEELGISIKITDDANKLKKVGNTIRGEVSTKGTFETRRRRIYGTTMGYQIVELLGSETESRNAGKSGVIVFGNEFAKKMAETLIAREFKPSQSLRYMGDIFKKIIEQVASKTPTVGKKVDILMQQPKFNEAEAQRHLNVTIDHDIKVLVKFRQELTEQIVQQQLAIDMADKIIDKGEIGRVVNIDGNMVFVQLNKDVQAMDGNWKQKAAPGQNVLMFTDSDNVKIGDKVIIENEDLCLKKDKSSLTCDIILCSL
ncbi:MJ0548 connectase family domain-containing protein [Methanobrevibacter sp.]